MTVHEMHIEFRSSANQIGSNTNRKFEPEEIDWILNKMQNRFIQTKLKPKRDGSGGFELDQISADQIRTLIVPSYEMIPYIDDDRRYMCFLPSDYAYLLSDWSFTSVICDPDETTPAIENDTLYITALRQDYSAGASPGGFYRTMKLQFQDRSITIPDDLPYGNCYQGYKKAKDVSFITPWIRNKGGLYWERFANLYYPGYYIHVSTTPPPSPMSGTSITIDGIVYNNVINSTLQLQRHPGTGKYYDNRLTATNKISGLNATAFYKT